MIVVLISFKELLRKPFRCPSVIRLHSLFCLTEHSFMYCMMAIRTKALQVGIIKHQPLHVPFIRHALHWLNMVHFGSHRTALVRLAFLAHRIRPHLLSP